MVLSMELHVLVHISGVDARGVYLRTSLAPLARDSFQVAAFALSLKAAMRGGIGGGIKMN